MINQNYLRKSKIYIYILIMYRSLKNLRINLGYIKLFFDLLSLCVYICIHTPFIYMWQKSWGISQWSSSPKSFINLIIVITKPQMALFKVQKTISFKLINYVRHVLRKEAYYVMCLYSCRSCLLHSLLIYDTLFAIKKGYIPLVSQPFSFLGQNPYLMLV